MSNVELQKCLQMQRTLNKRTSNPIFNQHLGNIAHWDVPLIQLLEFLLRPALHLGLANTCLVYLPHLLICGRK